jgi:hypothetical protein
MHRPFHVLGEFRTDESHRDWIVQNKRPVHQLVRGAPNGNTEGCLAGAASLHALECKSP